MPQDFTLPKKTTQLVRHTHLPKNQMSSAIARTAWPANQAPAGAVHCSDTADPKLSQLLVPPSNVKGGPEKLSMDSAKSPNDKERVARGCQLSLLSAINAGNTGTNRPVCNALKLSHFTGVKVSHPGLVFPSVLF